MLLLMIPAVRSSKGHVARILKPASEAGRSLGDADRQAGLPTERPALSVSCKRHDVCERLSIIAEPLQKKRPGLKRSPLLWIVAIAILDASDASTRPAHMVSTKSCRMLAPVR